MEIRQVLPPVDGYSNAVTEWLRIDPGNSRA